MVENNNNNKRKYNDNITTNIKLNEGELYEIKKKKIKLTNNNNINNKNENKKNENILKNKNIRGCEIDHIYDPLWEGCRSISQCYIPLNVIDSGTYGVVYKAKAIKPLKSQIIRSKERGQSQTIVALKQIKFSDKAVNKFGFPVVALREITLLMDIAKTYIHNTNNNNENNENNENIKKIEYGSHPNIVQVDEMVIGDSLGKIYMVMEYIPYTLRQVMDSMRSPFHISDVKCLLRQLLSAISYLHENWIIHRDLKSTNILYSNNPPGRLCLCDFGLARRFEDPINDYTPGVVTRWYRPPELLLNETKYSTEVDMWGCGCIFAEMLLKEPLWRSETDLEQLKLIFDDIGFPTNDTWSNYFNLTKDLPFEFKPSSFKEPKLRSKFPLIPHPSGNVTELSNCGFTLLTNLLKLDPNKRISSNDALNSDFFHESPLPTPQEWMPKIER